MVEVDINSLVHSLIDAQTRQAQMTNSQGERIAVLETTVDRLLAPKLEAIANQLEKVTTWQAEVKTSVRNWAALGAVALAFGVPVLTAIAVRVISGS